MTLIRARQDFSPLSHSQLSKPLNHSSATRQLDTTLLGWVSFAPCYTLPASDESLAKLFFSQRTLQTSAVGYEELVQLGLAFSPAVPLKFIFLGNLHYLQIQGEPSSYLFPW